MSNIYGASTFRWMLRLIVLLHLSLVLGASVHAQTAEPAANSAGTVEAVGPGDTLALSVFGQPQLNAQVTVGVDGSIVVPMLGSMQVDGLSPGDIGRRIVAGLRSQGFLLDPQVGVEVVRIRSRMVSVLGEVVRPGRYVLERGLTVLELLSLAGGLREDAGDAAVVLRGGSSDSGQRVRLPLFVGNRLEPAREIQNLALQPGDVVYVARAPRIYVYGEVGRPGAYPMEYGLDVMRALALAGGVTPRGSPRRIFVHRARGDDGEVVKHRADLTERLQPGDVVRVDERIF